MNKKKIALICVHNGSDFYLNHTLKQARLFNKDSDIYLLGNNSNIESKYAQHVMNSDYFESAKAFEDIYQHMSSNLYNYELFCFQRWFIIKDFVTKNNIDNFLCIDSDFLLFCDVSEVFSQYLSYDFTICQGHTPCATMFNKDSITRFCSFLMELYTNEDYLEQLKKRYQEEFVLAKKPGGNCDMTGFDYYRENISRNIKELTDIDDGKTFDGNINASDGYETEDSRKKVYWENNKPYCRRIDTKQLILFQGLHFQGAIKFKMHKYLVDDNLKQKSGLFYNLRNQFSAGLLKAKYKRYKRGLTKLITKR